MKKECPVCELMNDEAADTCRHCGTAFFFELECLEPRFNDELIAVGSFANVIEASLVKHLLECHGLRACIPEDMTPHLFGAIETVTVRVAAADVEAARGILRDKNGE